jgi:hypothetical protein
MGTPAPEPPRASGSEPPSPSAHRSPWGVVLLALVALALGVGAGVLIADAGDEQVKTVTHGKTVKSSGSTDVTVSAPTTTTTTTIEKTVTVTSAREQTPTIDTAP